MLRNRYVLGLLVFLLLANIVYYVFSGWGLITVKVHDVPLAKVIKSIEWQGWVTIYSNLPDDTKVSMYVDHVSLPEAMETLAVNCGARWKLGFFAAPTSHDVKDEIISFQRGAPGDGSKTYSVPSMPLQMVAGSSDSDSDEGLPISDPRLQVWPGKPVDDKSIGGYFTALAQAADIWIMAPSAWDTNVKSAPSANSSITHAVKSIVGSANGSVTTALVLQARGQRGGPGGGGGDRGGGGRGFGGDVNWGAMEDRARNQINGLPEDSRAGALAALSQEIKFRQDVAAAPEDQRRDMMRKHMADKFDAGGMMQRMSPEKRAQMFQRMVASRAATSATRAAQ